MTMLGRNLPTKIVLFAIVAILVISTLKDSALLAPITGINNISIQKTTTDYNQTKAAATTTPRNISKGSIADANNISIKETTTDYNQTKAAATTTPRNISKSSTSMSSFSLPKDNYHPVTEDCTPNGPQPLQTISGLFHDGNITRYFNTSIFFGTGPVVCEFRETPFWKHFSHTMQQLYGCYSYFQHHSNQKERQKILLMSENVHEKLCSNPFNKGFLGVLTDEGDATIQSRTKFQETHGDQIPVASISVVPDGYWISHVKELNELTQRWISKTSSPASNFGADSTSDICDLPRIAILNRRHGNGRDILNSESLAEILANLSHQQHVPVVYFEDKSFAEQVQFFHGADILLSPHGAQLTGLPFLAKGASKCAQLLELFPEKYIIPNYYGSLARNSNISYSYHYLSDQKEPTESELAAMMATAGQRIRARAQSLCISTEMIRASVVGLVEEWKKCCLGTR